MKEKSLKESVYQSLMEDIVRGEYRPGEIVTEGDFLDKYNCSRAPIREALGALCNEGILKNLPRCGYEIIRISLDDIQDILQLRLFIEGGVLDDVCKNVTTQRLQVLKDLNEKCNKNGESMWNHWDYNSKFHLKMLSYSGNGYAETVLRQTMSLLKCAYGQHYWDRWDFDCPSDMTFHDKIISAIERGKADEARNYLALDLHDFAAFS